VYPSASFDAKAVLEAVHNEKCTALHGVPVRSYLIIVLIIDHVYF
jgi:hypothetical protein